MAAVELRIVEPENDSGFIGIPGVTFRGELRDRPPELAEIPLYFRWYSSLYPDAGESRYSLNGAALIDPGSPHTEPTLGMGSHVITFAASDREGETESEIIAAQHGGVTGGLDGDARCLVHVFKSVIHAPAGGSVPRVGLTLKAEAPPLWAVSTKEEGGPPYVPNLEYLKYNRLRYRWRFEPTGTSAGRPTLEFTPDPEVLGFVDDPVPVGVTYQPALPSAATGTYRIVLYVEDALDQGLGRQSDSINVTLTG